MTLRSRSDGGCRRAWTRAALALAALSAAACGRPDDGRGDGGGGAVLAEAPAVSAPGDSACPNRTGRWDECNVRQRLERAGLAPQRASAPVRAAIFSVPGIGYEVGRAELQVYLYPDSVERARDVGRLDTLRVQGRDAAPIAWRATPTLMTSNNLAAVLLSDNATQVERVRLAMTAGLPAPSARKK